MYSVARQSSVYLSIRPVSVAIDAEYALFLFTCLSTTYIYHCLQSTDFLQRAPSRLFPVSLSS